MDYIFEKLLERERLYFDLQEHNKRLFTAEMRREYLIRFNTAILIDSYFALCSESEKAQIIKMLFHTSKKPSYGMYAETIRIICNHINDKKLQKTIVKLYKTFSDNIIPNRNDIKHLQISDIENVIVNIDTWQKRIRELDLPYFPMKDSMQGDFLIPVKMMDNNNVQCVSFLRDNMQVNAAYINRKLFNIVAMREDIMCKLFYRIIDLNSEPSVEKIYQLTPFIHYYDDPVKGIFTIYNHTIERSRVLRVDARSLFDEQLSDSKPDRILSSKRCEHELSNDIYMPVFQNEYYYKSEYCEINKSSYRDFQKAAENQYNYNEKIVNVPNNELLEFCRSTNQQVCIIIGNGGVGKTALLLHLVQKIMNGELREVSFDRMVFLSAKKYYLVESIESSASLVEKTENSDIESFEDFKMKIFQYINNISIEDINQYLSDNNNVIDSQYLADSIGISGKRILLMLDDMDTLTENDQNLIYDFVINLPAKNIKTIITTRDSKAMGTNKVELKNFNKDQSVEFALWFFKQKPSFETWKERLTDEDYIESLWQQTLGYPIFIITWISKALAQFPVKKHNIKKIYSEHDCVKYLYGSLINTLNNCSKILLLTLVEINTKCALKQIDEDLLYYISPLTNRVEMDKSVHELISKHLMLRENTYSLSLLDFDYNLLLTIDDIDGQYLTSVFFNKCILNTISSALEEINSTQIILV